MFLISRLMASVALGGEHVAVVGEHLAQRRQHPQLIAPDRVNTGLTALGPPDMQRGRSPKLPRWGICCEVLPAAPAVITCRRSLRSCARSRASCRPSKAIPGR